MTRCASHECALLCSGTASATASDVAVAEPRPTRVSSVHVCVSAHTLRSTLMRDRQTLMRQPSAMAQGWILLAAAALPVKTNKELVSLLLCESRVPFEFRLEAGRSQEREDGVVSLTDLKLSQSD